MAEELLDLDAVVASDLEVKLGGRRWKLPGDAPAELLLRIVHLQQELARTGREAAEASLGEADEETQAEYTEKMLTFREQIAEQLEELFSLRNQDFEPGTLQLNDVQVATLINYLYQRYTTVEEDGDRPTSEETRPKPKNGRPSARKSSGRRRSPSLTSSPS